MFQDLSGQQLSLKESAPAPLPHTVVQSTCFQQIV